MKWNMNEVNARVVEIQVVCEEAFLKNIEDIVRIILKIFA